MTKCPSCGSELESPANVCPDCGAQLEGVTASLPVIEGPSAVTAERPSAERPVLVVVKGAEVGERFEIDRPSLSIGRAPESDVFLNDVTVSRNHATVLLADGGSVSIRDEGSLNGTYVNGALVSEAPLRDGDHVQVGRFQMVFFAAKRGAGGGA
jgi:pSer/pThr/pTyr-binding forkhead associated (FHA) protein